MKDATLAQGAKVLNLILQQNIPARHLQKVIESGLLTDVLTGSIDTADRSEIRKLLGFEPWGVVMWRFVAKHESPAFEKGQKCIMREKGCEEIAAMECIATSVDGKADLQILCCENKPCQMQAERNIRKTLIEISSKGSVNTKNTVHLYTLSTRDCSGMDYARRVLVEKEGNEIIFPSGKKMDLTEARHDLSMPLKPSDVLYLAKLGCGKDDHGYTMLYSQDYGTHRLVI